MANEEKPKQQRRQAVGPTVRRGVRILEAEDRMLSVIMRYDNRRSPNRTEAIGNMIRAFYERLVAEGLIEADEDMIPRSEYAGWESLWGLD